MHIAGEAGKEMGNGISRRLNQDVVYELGTAWDDRKNR